MIGAGVAAAVAAAADPRSPIPIWPSM